MKQIQTTTAFTFSSDTLALIKNGAMCYNSYRLAVYTVREDAFIYGLKGSTTGDTFTVQERYRANLLLSKIGDALTCCKKWKELDNDYYLLYSLIGYISNDTVPGRRYSDSGLVHELFKIT